MHCHIREGERRGWADACPRADPVRIASIRTKRTGSRPRLRSNSLSIGWPHPIGKCSEACAASVAASDATPYQGKDPAHAHVRKRLETMRHRITSFQWVDDFGTIRAFGRFANALGSASASRSGSQDEPAQIRVFRQIADMVLDIGAVDDDALATAVRRRE